MIVYHFQTVGSFTIAEHDMQAHDIKNVLIFTAINCPKVYAPEYGTVVVKGYSHSSRAEYSCNHGYHLYGDGYITCNYGIWKGKIPICKRKLVDWNGTTVVCTNS